MHKRIQEWLDALDRRLAAAGDAATLDDLRRVAAEGRAALDEESGRIQDPDRGRFLADLQKAQNSLGVRVPTAHEALTLPAWVAAQVAAIGAAPSVQALDAVRAVAQGPESPPEKVFRWLADLGPRQKAATGRAANDAKRAVAAAVEARRAALLASRETSLADVEWVDSTLPGRRRGGGTIHPVSRMRRELEDLCLAMGFSVLDGPWVEDDFHNFEALNIPRDHPARDMHDTTWLANGMLLRTHTSPVQVRAMEARKPPIRAVAIGRVFRHEALDASHENTFHQIEGFLVDREVTVGHLVHTLRTLLSRVFGREVEVRLRPSFFPFTEPSFELDLRCLVCLGKGCPVCKRSGWVELLGCGLVHPNVLRAGGIDPAAWSGFAFGLGVDRLLMMRHGIEDIRHLMGGDLRFLRQFARGVEG